MTAEEGAMTQQEFHSAARLAQATIVVAQDREEGLRAARRLAAAAVCSGTGAMPCGICRDCRKVRENIHPDVITVERLTDDKGRKKREIGVDQIRRMAADAAVLPNEAARKVYIIDEADSMNASAQNAALKLLEEPPGGALFLLCAVNPQSLLPTVRSRCAELNCAGDEAEQDPALRQLAREYAAAALSGDRAALCRWCAGHEGVDSRAAADFLNALAALLADMLCGREPAEGVSREGLRQLLELVRRCSGYLQVNVGVKHLFGLLAVDGAVSGGNRG